MDCQLRPWRIEDAAQLAKQLSNRKVQDKLRDGIPYPYTEQDARDYIHSMLTADRDQTFAFAILVGDEVIGSIAAFRQTNIHVRTAEVGYYIGESYWGQGYGSSALCQFAQLLFDRTDLLRLFAEPFAGNTASCRMLEKAGFVCEGILRRNAVKNGVVLDMRLYALIQN